jgi:hypothetical protein
VPKKKKLWKCNIVDAIGRPLTEVISQMEQLEIQYRVERSRPTRNLSHLDQSALYVVRQRVDSDEIHHLIVAAKMAKIFSEN